MKAFVLCAGMGTRLKPWTDSHPKALVPVRGIPMLERVVGKLRKNGIEDITVNVHHFAEQVEEFINRKNWAVNISDERGMLLETGGAILAAEEYLRENEPILVHNVDILSNADFSSLLESHIESGADATLLVSDRESSRKLVFDKGGRLRGWHSNSTGEYRPSGFTPDSLSTEEYAFSGIYIISPNLIEEMKSRGWKGRFSIIDFLLSTVSDLKYVAHIQPDLRLLDIGKPEALARANRGEGKDSSFLDIAGAAVAGS